MTVRRALPFGLLLGAALLAGCAGEAPLARSGRHTVASADGVTIEYEVHGRGPRALVFVHGWSCDRGYWREQIGPFSGKYRVITLDLAGHGASGSGRAAWTIANFARDVAAVVEAEDARDVVLVGHSLGGPIVLEAAHRLPERVRGVVAIDTFVDFWVTPVMQQTIEPLRGDFAAATRSFVRNAMFLPTSPAALADGIAEAMSRAPPAVALPALDGLTDWVRERQSEAIASLRAPIGLIMPAGGPDHLKVFLRSRGHAPMAGIEIVAEAGHFPMLEAPAAFNARLQVLLDRMQTAPASGS